VTLEADNIVKKLKIAAGG